VIDVAAEGVTTVDYHATDVAGNAEPVQSLTIQIDKSSPVISGLPTVGCQLWPPNHELVAVGDVTATDALSGVAAGSLTIIGQSSQSSEVGPMVVVQPDGAGGFVVELQADRRGNGGSRIYTLTATATDVAGNVATSRATCTVPHDQRK
jgi:hypothetical protein